MEEIPGSALPGATHAPPDKPNTNKPLPPWATRGRWEARYGAGEKPSPFTRPIAKAVANRRAYEAAKRDAAERNLGLTDECARGARLLRGFAAGKLWPYPLKQRKERPAPPSAEQQLKAGAKWRLRGTYVELLAWLATAQVALRQRGLIATHGELGELLELRERRVREVLHELRRWGLVHQTPFFVAYGRVTSQRASIYRLTKLAIDTFGLPLDRSTAPDMEPGLVARTPRIARARKPGSNLPPTPDSTPVKNSQGQQTAGSGGAQAVELAVSTRSTPSARSTSVIASDTSMPTESSSSTDALRALSASPTLCRTAVPDESAATFHRDSSAKSIGPVGRLFEPEGREAAPVIADIVPRVRRGDVERKSPVVDDDGYRRRHEQLERERERRELDHRRAELERQVLERQAEEQRKRLEDVPPPADHDAPVDVGEVALDEERKRERERYKAELDEFSHVQPPARRRDTDDDFDEVIKRAQQTWEQTRFRKRTSPGAQRRDRGGDS